MKYNLKYRAILHGVLAKMKDKLLGKILNNFT